MEQTQQTALPKAYELKCALRYIEPPIWRRLRVPGDLTLSGLHDTLQTAFSWEDYHLYGFTIGDVEYGPDPEAGEPGEMRDDSVTALDDLSLSAGSSFLYTYDFGDGWEVDIDVEALSEHDPELTHPVCLDGARAAPPEDCGGLDGYEILVAAMKNKRHPERKELIEWLGGEFDPVEFDIDAVNEELALDSFEEPQPLPWIDRAAERMEMARADAAAPAPTDAEWKALYDAVLAFHAAAPWRTIPDDANFGVVNPEDGQAGYGTILGNAGELEGLMVYRGERGYDSLCRAKGYGAVDPLDMFLMQDGVGVLFGERDELDEADARRLKTLNLKFRGRRAWPSVQAFDPGFAPRPVNGAEARFLTLALDRAVQMPAILSEQPDLLNHTAPEDPIPVFVLAGDGWKIETREPKLTPPVIPAILPDAEALSALGKLQATEGVLELDFWPMPGGVQSEDGGPDLVPIVILAADPGSGAPLGMDTCSFADLLQKTVDTVCRIFQELKMRPGLVAVRRPELLHLLQPLGAALEFTVEMIDELPTLGAIQEDIMAQIASEAGFDV